MISERQEKILNFLIKEYISTAEPVGSKLLKKRADLDVCEATIRNDLQELAESGYISQPHTSAGRVPTAKAYQHFAEKITTQIAGEDEMFFCDFIFREIEEAKKQIESQLRVLQGISSSLDISKNLQENTFLQILITIDTWHKRDNKK